MKRSLRSWLWRVPVDQEIDEELDLHVEIKTRELIRRGMDPAYVPVVGSVKAAFTRSTRPV